MSTRSNAVHVSSLLITLAMTAVFGSAQTPDDTELRSLPTFTNGVDAYIYGYPLLMFGTTGKVGTTVPDAITKPGRAPLNQFAKETSLPTSAFKDVVLPSTTTLYASSFLNLQAEPVILHIPKIENRFFLLQMLDGWTNVSPESPGSRLNSQEGDYALVGPNWNKSLPSTITNVIRMDTDSMWIIGRFYTNGTDADVQTVVDTIYPGLTLTPLSAYGDSYTPPANLPVEPSVDTTTTPLHQVAGMDACAFFGNLASLMKYNPAILPQDRGLVRRLSEIGISKGQSFDCTAIDPKKLAALQLAVITARTALQFQLPISPTATYWSMPLNVGTYGNQYLLRAEVAENALGANNPIDAVYGYTMNDGTNTQVDGSNHYVIHFNAPTNKQNAGEIPPVNPKAFWSVTIYNSDGTLVTNHVVDYNAIGVPYVQGHHACFNSDHSLDLHLQADPPSGAQAFCNWLPTPRDKAYIVFLRMYWPDQAILNGRWIPPAIQKVN